MRPIITTIGLVIFFAGVILLSYSIQSQEIKVITDNLVSYVENGPDEPKLWSVSANLTEGDRIFVLITAGLDWPFGYFEPNERNIPILTVIVDVIDPHGNITRFATEYTKPPPGMAPETRLIVWNRTLLRNEGGIDPSPLYDGDRKLYEEIGGIVRYNGTYTVKIVRVIPPREYPPSRMEIRKAIAIPRIQDNSYLLPYGVASIVCGGVTASAGFISKRNFKKQKSLSYSKRK